uniref:Uncharacterized protein LOC111118469 n=1 Tax=Crassostrea virginica TaxID=6565 RepID=A0A8B8CD69_CRAVI|nr:uncharacterized protein LOC111118469 [Crassostrea virginica]
MLILGFILSLIVVGVGLISCVTLKRKFSEKNKKSPSVSTLVKKFDGDKTENPPNKDRTLPPPKNNKKSSQESVHSQRLMQRPPAELPATPGACSETSRKYESYDYPNGPEHPYRGLRGKSGVTSGSYRLSDHVYIDLE